MSPSAGEQMFYLEPRAERCLFTAAPAAVSPRPGGRGRGEAAGAGGGCGGPEVPRAERPPTSPSAGEGLLPPSRSVPLPDGRGRGEAAGAGGGCGGPEVPRAERPPTFTSASEQMFYLEPRAERCLFTAAPAAVSPRPGGERPPTSASAGEGPLPRHRLESGDSISLAYTGAEYR